MIRASADKITSNNLLMFFWQSEREHILISINGVPYIFDNFIRDVNISYSLASICIGSSRGYKLLISLCIFLRL